MQVTSSDFQNGEPIPPKYSHDGENINPPLTFSEIPEEAQSLALIVEDPDSPNGVFTHWILYNMSPGTLQIIEGELPISGVQGVNDAQERSYFGPKPHSGTHRYFFKLLALDAMLEIDEEETPVTREVFYKNVDSHLIKTAELMGTFSAPDAG